YILPVVEGGLKLLGLDPELAAALIKGFFEIDLGTMAAAQTGAVFGDRLIVSSAIIAWSGLSVLGQVISVIHGTDLRIWPFITARVLHGIIAGLYTYLLLGTVKVAGGVVPSIRNVKVGPLNRWY